MLITYLKIPIDDFFFHFKLIDLAFWRRSSIFLQKDERWSMSSDHSNYTSEHYSTTSGFPPIPTQSRIHSYVAVTRNVYFWHETRSGGRGMRLGLEGVA